MLSASKEALSRREFARQSLQSLTALGMIGSIDAHRLFGKEADPMTIDAHRLFGKEADPMTIDVLYKELSAIDEKFADHIRTALNSQWFERLTIDQIDQLLNILRPLLNSQTRLSALRARSVESPTSSATS